jgi:hypothetical protein
MTTVMTSGGTAGKSHRSGTLALVVTDLTRGVTFTSAMPSASYRVVFERGGVTAAVLWASAKTTTGFTANLSVGIVETIGWLAVED